MPSAYSTRILLVIGAAACATRPGSSTAPSLGMLLEAGTLVRSNAPVIVALEGDRLTLAEAYRLALARSEQVSLAERGVRDAEIRSTDRWTQVAPNLNLTAAATLQRERLVGTSVLIPSEQLSYGAQLEQPIFRRGFFDSRAAGRHARESATAGLRRQREELAREVAEAFIGVLSARNLLENARAAVKRTEGQLQHAVARVKAGNALKSAELLAMVDVRRAERQAILAERDVETAGIAFQRRIGVAPPAELVLPVLAEQGELEAEQVARSRADVVARRASLQEAEAEQRAARGRRWWPRLDLEARVQYIQPELLGRSLDWLVMGTMTVPLLQNGREHTDLALRENAARIAALELERQRKVAVEETELAGVEIASARRAEEGAKKQLDAATSHYKLVDTQFRLGAITFLEVTNAQAVLVEAENAYEAAKMDQIRAAFDYQFAVGTLKLE